MTKRQKTVLDTVHACNSRGIKYCGSRTTGDQRTNVATDPTLWRLVTCTDCLATRES